MSFDSLTNHGEYLSAYYVAEVLPDTVKKDVVPRWTAAEKAGEATPRQGIRALRQDYFTLKAQLADLDGSTDSVILRRDDTLQKLHSKILEHLGYPEGLVDATPVDGLAIVQAGWADDTDAVTNSDGAGKLLEPYIVDNRRTIETGFALATFLFADSEPPRYVLILNGGVITLADGHTWSEARYLSVSLDSAFGRNDARPGGELDLIAALFGAESLQPSPSGDEAQLAKLVAQSRQKAVGVSGELREGLRVSVELIANEVLDRIREHGVDPTRLMEPRELARELGRESLRYLYRILFLLYAEARPELGVLPARNGEYTAGYSMARLGDLVSRKLGGEQARRSFHLYESLDLLFRMVNDGHEGRGLTPVDDNASEGKGIRFEALKSDLFLAERTKHIGPKAFEFPDSDSPDDPKIDTRLRNGTLYQVLRLLMLTKGKRKERGGFISYAQLGINQLGAVYEGLMSYSGFIAAEELNEVAKNGDSKDGSWMIPVSKADEYDDEVFVKVTDEETGVRQRVRYRAGAFVYRLAGRDRQTSASYYTPQSLTEVTVELALKYRMDQDGTPTEARELLNWTICEPALGSGAFLNEAINQVAAEYLRRRQSELNTRIDPDQYATELLKVKAYIALHNSYGVDLNRTAVELAEVSLWLNVMHQGLQAPWFGLHLRRGNSLIGARRQYYTPDQLVDKAWLTTAPTDHPLRSTEPLPPDGFHHFLLPADGWGAVAGEKEAKNLAPEDAKRLGDWRRKIKVVPTAKGKNNQVQRLQAVSRRVERLWDLVRQRLVLSEQKIRREIGVWGAEGIPAVDESAQRDEIKADLEREGGPYWRLKTLMDTWCALWFWPLDKASLLDGTDEIYGRVPTVTHVVEREVDEETVTEEAYEAAVLFGDEQPALPLSGKTTTKKVKKKFTVIEQLDRRIPLASLDDWLDFAEAVIGRTDIPVDSLVETFTSLATLTDYEEQLAHWTNTDSNYRLFEHFPWLTVARGIADDQGFFHWEVEFAGAFANGGFDLQAGNPPWVRLDWDEADLLAEYEPWFVLAQKPSPSTWQDRKSRALSFPGVTTTYSNELAAHSGAVAFIGAPVNYALLAGTRPDLYRAFMCQIWSHLSIKGTAGLVHPDTHFGGKKEAPLRCAAYGHLRVHGSFVNAGNWAFAPPVGRNIEFGVHVYGNEREISFLHASQLYGATVLRESLIHDGLGDIPGQKHNRMWDRRPHRARVVEVNAALLGDWQRLAGDPKEPTDRTPLLFPITLAEQGAISAIADYRHRLRQYTPSISAGYNEANSKRDGLITFEVSRPSDPSEVVLQGPHLGAATPLYKQPQSNGEWKLIDLTTLHDEFLSRTNYVRSCDRETFLKAQDYWHGRPHTQSYRLAWRKMIDTKAMERSLFAAIIPPGPAHVHAVHSLALRGNAETAVNAGFWASLPLDYLLRITGRSDLQVAEANAMPAALVGHPLASPLLLRTLRLNCLTRHYEALWAELYDASWAREAWATEWPGLDPLPASSSRWSLATPLRTERARRSALVEIDALVSVWIGIGLEQLTAVLRSRYPILTDREDEMWFDTTGRRIARDPYAFGFGQEKGDYQQLIAHLSDPQRVEPPKGYAGPFYKADRENEYRQAHAVFSARLQAAKDAGWEPSA